MSPSGFSFIFWGCLFCNSFAQFSTSSQNLRSCTTCKVHSTSNETFCSSMKPIFAEEQNWTQVGLLYYKRRSCLFIYQEFNTKAKPQRTHCVLAQNTNEFSIKDSSDWFLFKAWMEDSGAVGEKLEWKLFYNRECWKETQLTPTLFVFAPSWVCFKSGLHSPMTFYNCGYLHRIMFIFL